MAPAINGMSDHTHIPFHLPPTIALAKAISTSKNQLFQMNG